MKSYLLTVLESALGDWYLPDVHATDVLEIAILSVIFYQVIKWIKNTKAWMLLRGIIVLAVFIFIAPPSFNALYERLKRRGTERQEVITERLAKARRELRLMNDYDYIVINDEVNNAADRIRAIIRAEHASTKRSAEGYIELLEESENDNTK